MFFQSAQKATLNFADKTRTKETLEDGPITVKGNMTRSQKKNQRNVAASKRAQICLQVTKTEMMKPTMFEFLSQVGIKNTETKLFPSRNFYQPFVSRWEARLACGLD